jgi:hypothetical protein
VALTIAALEAQMKHEHRRLAMKAWRELFALTESKMSAEVKYFSLLRRADAMERAELITSDEWVMLVKEAGTSLASTAECMGGPG